jgi:uncharacterized protein (TIGR03790 family)
MRAKRNDDGKSGKRRWIGVILVPAFILAAASWLQADNTDGSTNASAATPSTSWPKPLITPNPATQPFLDSHPEMALPLPQSSEHSSAPADSAPDSAPPEENSIVPTDSAETSPETDPLGDPEDLPAHLLVVYNSNDPDSKDLAEYYAARRNIPDERVLGISCATNEEINREQYEDTIRSPIMDYLLQKNWMVRHTEPLLVNGRAIDLLVATRNDIWAIVLMRGVPLKIAADPSDEDSMESNPRELTDAAAVDSELAMLPIFGLPKGGWVPNLFFDKNLTGFRRAGPQLARNIVMVTRLDGPTPAQVRRMIDDCLFVEKTRLAGLAVIDTRGLTDVKNNYTYGDIWLRNSRDMLLKDGWSVKFDDNPDVLPPTDPCNEVALYLGWYAENATGPWVTPPFRFVPGAIAYHLHSFSASTVRSTTANWVGPLISHGADATMGTVYEPYLELTPHEDIFTKRLLQGNYFAEAAYASQEGLSWMTTVVGDPLYRPFRQSLDAELALASNPHTDHDDWVFLQKVRRELVSGRTPGNVAALERRFAAPGIGSVAEEGLGDLLEGLREPSAGPAAETAYEKAMRLDFAPIDRIRVGLKLAQNYVNHGEDGQAQVVLRTLREIYPQDAERFGVASPLMPTSIPAGPAAPSTVEPVPSWPAAPLPPRPPQPQDSPPPAPKSQLPPLPQQPPEPQ